MSEYSDVPIFRAKKIADKYEKDQVIIVCWDKYHGRTHVTTYGITKKDCEEAAKGGNMVKKALGWPDELCHDKPDKSFEPEKWKDSK